MQACVNGQDCTACDVSEYENLQVLLWVIHVNVNFLFQGSTDLWKQKLWSSLPVRKLSSCPRNKKNEGLFGECAGIIFGGEGWGGGGVWHKGDNQMLVKNCKVYFLYLMGFLFVVFLFVKGNNILFHILMGEKRGWEGMGEKRGWGGDNGSSAGQSSEFLTWIIWFQCIYWNYF